MGPGIDGIDSAVVLRLSVKGSDCLEKKGIYCSKNEPEREYPVWQRTTGECVAIGAVLSESRTIFDKSLNW
jgi:hypothetical protein